MGRRKPSLEKIKIPDNQENMGDGSAPFDIQIIDSSVTKEGFSPPWAEWDFNEWETCTDMVRLLLLLLLFHYLIPPHPSMQTYYKITNFIYLISLTKQKTNVLVEKTLDPSGK